MIRHVVKVLIGRFRQLAKRLRESCDPGWLRGVGRRRTRENWYAGQHFVQHGSECEQIRAVIDRLAAHVLGRHVGDRTKDDAGSGIEGA